MNRRELERRLADVRGFPDPRADLEQYPTPADLAAHLLHLAAMQGDLGETVVDLGAGTGVLALGAALLTPARVVGVERDPAAITVARANERAVAPPLPVDWVVGDARRPPVRPDPAATTVVMNPPFGAQRGREHADRAFLASACDLAAVSYSVHNAGSREFVESFVADAGGRVTHAFAASLGVDHQFDFHAAERRDLSVEVYRIEWCAAT